MKNLTLVLYLLLIATPLTAEELISDRPDFTESSETILPGKLQIETGYTFVDDVENSHTAPELLLRFGISDSTELRFDWAGYTEPEGGWEDLGLGFKQKLYEVAQSLRVSLIAGTSLPTGSRELTADKPEPEAKVIFAYDLTEDLGLASNVNYAYRNGEIERYHEMAASLTAGYGISETWGSYFEYFGIYPMESVPETDEHYLNTGLTYLVNEDFQVDLRVGLGLTEDSDDFFSGFGFVYRTGN